jgi:hypothetical protein
MAHLTAATVCWNAFIMVLISAVWFICIILNSLQRILSTTLKYVTNQKQSYSSVKGKLCPCLSIRPLTSQWLINIYTRWIRIANCKLWTLSHIVATVPVGRKGRSAQGVVWMRWWKKKLICFWNSNIFCQTYGKQATLLSETCRLIWLSLLALTTKLPDMTEYNGTWLSCWGNIHGLSCISCVYVPPLFC